MLPSLPGVPREAALRRLPGPWAVSRQPARVLSRFALGDRSHAVSPVRSVVERCKTGKMRLLAGFLPSNALGLRGPVHSSGGIVRTVPTLISASMRCGLRGFGGSSGAALVFALAAHTTGSFGGAWTLEKIYRLRIKRSGRKKLKKLRRSPTECALHCNKRPYASQRYVVAAIRRSET